MIKNYLKVIILVVAFFSLGIFVGQNVNFDLKNYPNILKKNTLALGIKNTAPPAGTDVDFTLFWKVWERVQKDYLDKSKVDPQKLYNGAIKGMVAAIGDPYTVYLDSSQNQDFNSQMSGTFEGVGIQLGIKDQKLVVIAPIDGSPAQSAGVKASDIIIAIDDKDAAGMSLPEAVNLIRGKAGTQIKITFIHEGSTDPDVKQLTRATINVKSVVLTKKGDVQVIKVSQFGDKTNTEWNEAVDQVVSSGVKKVVLDMRNNPGGILQSAITVVSTFVDKDKIAVQQENASGVKMPLFTSSDGRLKNTKVVVLINKGSASASEIVAGALRDLRLIKLVGDKSFGKGTVQEVQPLDGGGGLHLTTSKWLTPKDTWVHEKGLEPDVKVEAGEDVSKDPQLDKAIELLK